jgi:3-hydroxyisobutyrate dehydrogenase-like beta-hydroxyacid dehydrogenase
MARVGFVGTGNIGAPMAHRMLSAGHELHVFDVRPEAARTLLEAGASPAASPRELAERCELVLSSLPGPVQLESVVCGDAGLVAGARKGLVHVELSTISLACARRVHALEEAVGIAFLDCPVSGGAVLARRGALTLMASGDRTAFERAQPVLAALGERIFHLGEEVGTGTLAKLINNAIFLCAGQLAQEGFVLGARAGLDPSRLFEILRVSSSSMYLGMVPAALARAFDVEGFTMTLAEKDVALALDTARELAVPMPATAAAHQTYVRGLAAGAGEKLFTATLEAIESAAGVRLPACELG